MSYKCIIILNVNVYGDCVMNRTNMYKLRREFNEGRTNIHDDQMYGRPSICD